MKTQQLAFLVCSHFFFLPCTFISVVLYCESSGHLGMRFRRKTQYRIKLPNTHLRVGKRLKRARKKPKGVSATGGHKGHFVFFHVPLLSLPFCLLFLLFMALCCVFTSAPLSVYTDPWNVRFGVWTMGITKTNPSLFFKKEAEA